MSTTNLHEADVDSWYRAYATQLRFAARRIVGNRADAEDAIQEAFVAAWRAIDRYDGSDPYPWLYRIATRKALSIAAGRRATACIDDVQPPVGPSAEDVALDRFRAGQIQALVGHEPDVALHLVGGLRFRELGERFGIPLSTAATRVRRGKLRLRSQLRATLTGLPESQSA